MCSEPRDRVYALVNLARNGAGFPIDYRKSLYDVWKDTMEFLSRKETATDQADLLALGARLKRQLMPTTASHTADAARSSGPTNLSQFLTKPALFRLTTVPVGRVVCVGPSAADVISSPSAGTEWCQTMAACFEGEGLGRAR